MGHLRSVSGVKDMARATLGSLETSERSVFTASNAFTLQSRRSKNRKV